MRLTVIALSVLLSLTAAMGQETQQFDLKLVVKTALENHPSLKGSQAQIAGALAQLRQAKAGYMPRVDLTASYTQLHRDPSFTIAGMGTMVFGEKSNPQLSWIVKLPIFTGGKLEALVKQADAGTKASIFTFERQKQKVALDAIVAYFNVLKAHGFVKVMEDKLKALQSQRDDIAKMIEQGIATRVDLLRAETAVAAAQEELTKAKNGEALALAAWRTLWGFLRKQLCKSLLRLQSPMPYCLIRRQT